MLAIYQNFKLVAVKDFSTNPFLPSQLNHRRCSVNGVNLETVVLEEYGVVAGATPDLQDRFRTLLHQTVSKMLPLNGLEAVGCAAIPVRCPLAIGDDQMFPVVHPDTPHAVR